jgi:hypothetical protein
MELANNKAEHFPQLKEVYLTERIKWPRGFAFSREEWILPKSVAEAFAAAGVNLVVWIRTPYKPFP